MKDVAEINFRAEHKHTRIEQYLLHMHAEISEAYKEIQYVKTDEGAIKTVFCYPIYSDTNVNDNKPEGLAVELADVLILLLGVCNEYNIPLEMAFYMKLNWLLEKHGTK